MTCANTQALARYETQCYNDSLQEEKAIESARDLYSDEMNVAEAYAELWVLCGGEDAPDDIIWTLHEAFERDHGNRHFGLEDFLPFKGTSNHRQQVQERIEESLYWEAV